MTPHDLILEYVAAARAAERWTATVETLTCPLSHLHARGKRLLPAGQTCSNCRARVNAMHKANDALNRRRAALAEQHRYIRAHEVKNHVPRQRRRVKRGTGLA